MPQNLHNRCTPALLSRLLLHITGDEAEQKRQVRALVDGQDD
jgi:hypothetical protein